MEKSVIKSSRLGESYIKIKHDTGLTILLYPMCNYSTVYATFGTKYGSIDTKFKTQKDSEFITVPEGIAHYLEHKLFENEDCDAFVKYAKTGANANAYTSFEKTTYLFSCSDNFYDSLEILLDFVQHPYFTEATVQKEQGIIGQEIKMYDDVPTMKLFYNLLDCLYVNHPVKIDIAGTVESIAKIDADLLYKCYNTFYNLNNMVISVAGNFNVEKTLEIIEKNIIKREKIEITRGDFSEPREINKKFATAKMPISVPMFAIGYKAEALSGEAELRAIYEAKIASEIIVGNGSQLNKKLYDSGLINENFEIEIFSGNGYFSVLFEGESSDPQKVYDLIDEEIEKVKKNGFNKEDFAAQKKAAYGEQIKIFNNVSDVAEEMQETEFRGLGVYDSIELLEKMTYDDVMNRINVVFDKKYSAISTITSSI